jgi:hypothetical protein
MWKGHNLAKDVWPEFDELARLILVVLAVVVTITLLIISIITRDISIFLTNVLVTLVVAPAYKYYFSDKNK